MSEISPVLRSYLLRHLYDMKYRKFLIHTLTRSIKQGMVLRDELVKTIVGENEPVEIDLTHSLRAPIRPDLVNALSKDEEAELSAVDQWIYKNNISMILENNDTFQLLLAYQNFTSYKEEEQALADQFSQSVRDVTNVEYYKFVLDNFVPSSIFEIIELHNESGKGYVCELTATYDQLIQGKASFCILSDNTEERLMSEIDTLEVHEGEIPNVKGKIKTTVGRVIVNQLCFVDPFGDTFPYEDKVYNLEKDILATVNQALVDKRISVENYKRCLDNCFYIGHFTELCTPCLDEHALSTDPNIKKRKAELIKQYEGQLNDPIVISKIEDELIAMDKEYMKGDNALRFYATESKAFPLWRKKLYIAVGGIEAFSKDSSKYDFLRNSLEEGIRVEDLSIYGNESRKGSYQRGHETQKGGYMTKSVIRAFHDSAITRPDCGTRKGVLIDFSKISPNKFIGRYILLHGKWVELTTSLAKSIPLKPTIVRSPMYCQCKEGYCYKCVGRFFEGLDVRQVSMSIVDISNTFMTAAMKNMHGSKLALYEITSLDQCVL